MKIKEVRPGFEKEAELLLSKKEALEADKKQAIEEAIKKINGDFAERENTITAILNLVTVDVEIEEPVEEVIEDLNAEVASSTSAEAKLTEDLEAEVAEKVENEVAEEEAPVSTVRPSAPIATTHIRFN